MTLMSRSDFFTRWSALHGGAEIRGVVKGWLTISFAAANFLRRLRITANGLTAIGVLLSVGLVLTLYVNRYEIRVESSPSLLFLALALLVVALAADGIDGSVALITGSASRRGAALDAIADRVAETLWAYAFILIGAEPVIVMVTWLVAQIQEYVRARLGGLGISEIGVVTICERPVRASFLAVALVVATIFAIFESSLGGGFLGVIESSWISGIALLWFFFQAIALVQLSRFAIRSTIGPR